MSADSPDESVDLLIVGGGPTGISIAAEATRAGVDALIVEKGPLLASLLDFPRDMVFFTTRERLEIADVPFAIPDPKPTRRQAVSYYHGVARRYELALALHERVERIEPTEGGFLVTGVGSDGRRLRRAHAVAMATGYYDNPNRLGVDGEELPWVAHRFDEPLRHFDETVLVVGGGNSAVEAAMELWRSGARVTLVHRGEAVRPSVKYWLRPDFENRVEEGSIAARYGTVVTAFRPDGRIELEGEDGHMEMEVDAAYVLIGYQPDMTLLSRAGVAVDAESLVPEVDQTTCESNVPGLYVAGTLQAGRDTNRIFIENSRDHSSRIVNHLAARLRARA
ncbi:MAG: YpdA family putative bacillithiol disulfide reductase [Thermoanaerobaculia bacterium]|nr:YpdA family putative bacillithiol disulfide reductase [Thermoanaerobaculia bacterium]